MSRVLLVDDEKIFRSSLAQRLRLRGYDVTEAGDGAEAVRTVNKDSGIDVVILDYNMPGMRGEQALREIKSSRPQAAVIILTAFDCRQEPGAWACLEKPCDLDQLIHAIDSARLSKTGARDRK